MLKRFWVDNYRSLKSVTMDLGQLTVVTGANGSGKSNLYSALGLLQSAAAGRLSVDLLEEGGMPSALWAGGRGTGPVRMKLGFTLEELSYEVEAGLVAVGRHNPFVLDPEIKAEYVWLGAHRKKSTTMVDRGSGSVSLTNFEGSRELIKAALNPSESVISQIADPSAYPELSFLRSELARWRFYHHFDTARGGHSRAVLPGVRTRTLAADGANLGAAIATLSVNGDIAALHEAVNQAFPGYRPVVLSPDTGHFGAALEAPGLTRPLAGSELSDGQLRFLCLAVALLSTEPPPLLVLNEPETSLHPRAVAALAPLIVQASQFSQVWVTTHDMTLRDALADRGLGYELVNEGGVTSIEPWN